MKEVELRFEKERERERERERGNKAVRKCLGGLEVAQTISVAFNLFLEKSFNVCRQKRKLDGHKKAPNTSSTLSRSSRH